MVMDRGSIVEFDTPRELGNDANSMFYSLLQESKKNLV
jgi:ABC-type multidrug transport system fused ATPase/permease subunit